MEKMGRKYKKIKGVKTILSSNLGLHYCITTYSSVIDSEFYMPVKVINAITTL